MSEKKIYPKKACPVCKMMISTHHLSWGNHMNTHGEMAKMEGVTADAERNEPEFANEKDKGRYEKALQAQKRFLKAPEVFVGSQLSDERGELVKLYCPEAATNNPTKHCYFGRARDADVDASKGYAPVMNEHGVQVQHGGDPLWWIPQAQYEMICSVSGEESRRQLNNMRTPLKKDEKLRRGVIDEQLEIEENKKMEDI